MNKGRLKITGTERLREISKGKTSDIIGNSLLTSIFALGTLAGGSLPLSIGYLLLSGFFGYGIVTSIKDKIDCNKEIQLRDEVEQKTL